MIRSVRRNTEGVGYLARGQHGDEETLDHDRLLLRVGVLARHVHVRGQAVVEWRQLNNRFVVGEGELKLAKLQAQHTDAAHLVRGLGLWLWLWLGFGLGLRLGLDWLRVRVQLRVRVRVQLRVRIRVRVGTSFGWG